MLEFLKEHELSILVVLNYIIVSSLVITILLKNINPTKTLSYIIILVFFPFLGILVYYLFGQEYRKEKIFNRKDILNKNVVKTVRQNLELSRGELKAIDIVLDEKIKLVKLLNTSENAPLTLHNDLLVLKNGEQKFEYLIKDLQNAKHHIHLEYYILKDDIIGSKIIKLICDKAKEGVEVRLSFDDVGSSISNASKEEMKQSGVQFYPFMPVLFSSLTGKMNYRNHRKIVVIDGYIGYVGGINISDNYMNYDVSNYWRDTHLRVIGEAVQSLQIHFLTNWDFVSKDNLIISEKYFPKISSDNELPIQIAASGPDTDWANIMEAIFTAINNAESYIYITTPYFIPNEQIYTALQVAAKSGIIVKLLIPKKSDSKIAKYATDSYLEDLLRADVKVYRYTKGFIHAKTIVIDDIFSTVGTSNMDNRSFNINFEINALIYNKSKAIELKQMFEDDLCDSELVDFTEWENRSTIKKLKESISRLWAPLL
jgi:cardiolipin synthase